MRYQWSWVQLALSCVACVSYRAQPLPAAGATSTSLEHGLEQPRTRLNTHASAAGVNSTIAIDPSDGLSSDEAAVLAVLLNPDLVALRDEHNQAQAQIVAAGILPNPVLGLEYEHPYGNNSEGTNDVLNLSLSWDLKPLLARSAKRDAAQASLGQADLGIAWQEWQVAQQARLLVVRLGWIRRRIALANQERDFESETARALEHATTIGDATLEQLGVQRASLEAARNIVFELEQLALTTESELLKLLGNPREAGLLVPTPALEKQTTTPTLATCLSQRLDLQALRHGYRAQEASVRAAVIDQFPDISVGLSHQHNETALDFVGGFVSVALPVFDRNQAEVRLAQATRRRLEHEYDARVASVRADLDQLQRYSELMAKQLPHVAEAIASLEKIEVDERQAVANGDLDRLSYQAVRSALLDQRLQYAAMSQALAESAVGVGTICGVPPMVSKVEP